MYLTLTYTNIACALPKSADRTIMKDIYVHIGVTVLLSKPPAGINIANSLLLEEEDEKFTLSFQII